MTDGHEEEFRALFLAEAEEQLDRLGDTVLELERAGGGAELVATLFRDAHTMKSSAALVGLPAVSEVAHLLEDLLGELRTGARTASPGLADGVLEVVDALRGLIAAGLAGAPDEAWVAAARAGLARAAAAGGPEPAAGGEPVDGPAAARAPERVHDPAPAPRAGAAPAPTPRAAAGPGPREAAAAHASFQDPAFRQLFVDEVVPELERLAEVALELEQRGSEPELVAALFRGAHSLKGSAAVVGFTAVAALAHELEERLSELRAGTREATPALVDALLVALDAVRTAAPRLTGDAPDDPALDAARVALAALGDAPAATATEAAPAAATEPAPAAAPARTTPPAPAIVDAPLPAASGPPEQERTPPTPPAAEDPVKLVPVALDRLDGLVRLSGEAVAAHLHLSHLLRAHIADDADAEAASLALKRLLGDVQDQTLRTRMTTLGAIASALRRAVRDVARAAGKEVEYVLDGDRTELDRAVLDGLREPLLHLVRNAVDHGLEGPDVREACGKPRVGSVRVSAERRGPEIVVRVADDGAGLDLDALRRRAGAPTLDDHDAAQLVFRPGLSTADAVTDVSGRGVGMDAVRAAVQALRGRVEVGTERGRGCTFTVVVPLTLAVVPCITVAAGGQRYHLPAQSAVRIADRPQPAEVGLEGGTALWIGGDIVPLSRLHEVLGFPDADADPDGPALVLEATTGARHAFRVDAVLGQRDVTVKELGAVVPHAALLAGASIEADGSVVLVLDAAELLAVARRARRRGPLDVPARVFPEPGAPKPRDGDREPARALQGRGEWRPAAPTVAPAAPQPTPSVLVVDDAMTVRELQRSILSRAGYDVRVAVDGEDALALLAGARPDLVITDVEMPRLDGFGLVAAIRRTPGLASLPVLMVTSRSGDDDRRRGLEAGADAYLVKQDFDEASLLGAVERLLGARAR